MLNQLTRNLSTILATIFAVTCISGAAYAGTTINGAGATFPYPVYAQWAYLYNKETGVKLNYQSIGSGGGIKQITAKTVDFGASAGLQVAYGSVNVGVTSPATGQFLVSAVSTGTATGNTKELRLDARLADGSQAQIGNWRLVR